MTNPNSTQKHKHYEVAYRAYTGTSFSPERRAENVCKEFDQSIESLKALNVPADKIERYESLWLKWMNAKSRCLSSMITGPANFPTARNEKANNAEHRACNALCEYYDKLIKKAKHEKYYQDNPEARPIKAGDSDAIERLQKKIDSHKKAHETMKTVNKIVRAQPIDMDALEKLLGSKEKAEKMIEPDYAGRVGFASYALNNNRAEIKRLEGRLKELQTRKEQPTQEIEVNGVRVVQNNDDMRLELYFDGKPDAEIRSLLKSNAFRWAPSKGAWQRQLTNNALYAFKHFVKPQLEAYQQ